MNNQLTTTRPDISPADIFFDRPIQHTDWLQMMFEISAGLWKSSEVLEEIKAMEPMAEKDPRDFQHWQKQQLLRLCLLHEAGKPMEIKVVCDCCGHRPCDPLFGGESKYTRKCLHCAEESEQTYNGGGRGSCEFVRPHYNQLSMSWGLLYYWSHGGQSENTFILWLADFYKTRQDAAAALQPVKHYIDWLNVKYNGLIAHWIHFLDLIDLEDVMAQKLPLTPEGFRELLRSKIEAHMAQEQNVMGYYVRDALGEYERGEKDG